MDFLDNLTTDSRAVYGQLTVPLGDASHSSIGAFCRNLTNEAAPNFVAATGPTGFTSDYASPPRTYGLSAQYRFGSNMRRGSA